MVAVCVCVVVRGEGEGGHTWVGQPAAAAAVTAAGQDWQLSRLLPFDSR